MGLRPTGSIGTALTLGTSWYADAWDEDSEETLLYYGFDIELGYGLMHLPVLSAMRLRAEIAWGEVPLSDAGEQHRGLISHGLRKSGYNVELSYRVLDWLVVRYREGRLNADSRVLDGNDLLVHEPAVIAALGPVYRARLHPLLIAATPWSVQDLSMQEGPKRPWLGVLVCCACLGAADAAKAQWPGYDVGVGGQVGDPTGVTLKVWLDDRNALQGTAGWEMPYRPGRVFYSTPFVTGDWVLQLARLKPERGNVWFALHCGAGAAVGWARPQRDYYNAWGKRQYVGQSLPSLTARGPLAFNVYLTKLQWEYYVELVVAARLFPVLYPVAMGGTGARYYW